MMKYMMLICWDAERMDGQTEPDPSEPREEERFPWLDDVHARGVWGTRDPRAAPRPAPPPPCGPVRRTQGARRRLRHHRLREPGRGGRDRGWAPTPPRTGRSR